MSNPSSKNGGNTPPPSTSAIFGFWSNAKSIFQRSNRTLSFDSCSSDTTAAAAAVAVVPLENMDTTTTADSGGSVEDDVDLVLDVLNSIVCKVEFLESKGIGDTTTLDFAETEMNSFALPCLSSSDIDQIMLETSELVEEGHKLALNLALENISNCFDADHIKSLTSRNCDGGSPSAQLFGSEPEEELELEQVQAQQQKFCLCHCDYQLGIGGPRKVCMARSSMVDDVLNCHLLEQELPRSLYRPSLQCSFQALCETHLQLFRLHRCCPTCGRFCVQGEFFMCSASRHDVFHWFHLECAATGALCPHCGSSKHRRVTIGLHLDPTTTSSQLRRSKLCDKLEQLRKIHFSKKVSQIDTNWGASSSSSDDVTAELVTKPMSSVYNRYLPSEEDYRQIFDGFTAANERLQSLPAGIIPKLGTKDLLSALRHHDLPGVLACLISDVSPNSCQDHGQRNSALHLAAINNFYLAAVCLILAGATVDVINHAYLTPLAEAVLKINPRIVGLLIACGAMTSTIDVEGRNPLHFAAIAGDLEVVKLVLGTRQIDVDSFDQGFWTPLQWACHKSHTEVVRYLLENGAQARTRDLECNTALHWIAETDDVDSARLLLEQICRHPVDRCDVVDRTTLVAYVNYANDNGDTALHVASLRRKERMLEFLIVNGADVTLKNNGGQTAAEMWKQHPLPACLAMADSIRSVDASDQTDSGRKCKIIKGGNGDDPRKCMATFGRIVCSDISEGKERWPISAINQVDDAPFPADFRYVIRPIGYGLVQRAAETMISCDCRDNCSTESCTCALLTRFRYQFESPLSDGTMHPDYPYDGLEEINECNDMCSCNPRFCCSRLIQHGIRLPLQLFKTGDKGWGVRVLEDVPKGRFICEYLGEIVSNEEATRRADDSYMMDLDIRLMTSSMPLLTTSSYALSMTSSEEPLVMINKDYVIDARHFGNVARFINHSCVPNLASVKSFYDHYDLRHPHLCFFSIRRIHRNEELSIDYGTSFWAAKLAAAAARQTAAAAVPLRCKCGEASCRYASDELVEKFLGDYAAAVVQGPPKVQQNGIAVAAAEDVEMS